MLSLLQSGNLLVRLLVELVALASLAVWAWGLPVSTAARWTAALVVALGIATGWAVLLSPGSPVAIPATSRVVLQLGVFALAALSLLVTGRRVAALVFATVAVVNAVLIAVWNQ